MNYWAIPGAIITEDKTLHLIASSVASFFNITMEEMQGKSRINRIIEVRHVYFVVARKITNKSLEQIGKEINKDHTTVLYAINKYNYDSILKENVRKYESYINKNLSTA